jgi:thymidine phosphorylase
VGDRVAAGETMFTVYAEQEARLEPVAEMLSRCYTLGSAPPDPVPLIEKIVV